MLSPEQRTALVRLYYCCGRNSLAAINAYRRETGIRNVCNRKTVDRLIRKFEATGAVKDAPRSGRPKLSEETVAEVALTAVEISGSNIHGECSTRAVAQSVGISPSTAWKVMRKQLKLFPYHIHRLFELDDADYPRRLAFAEDFLVRVEMNPDWLDSIIWSDEAHFTLKGQVNSRNCVIWADHNPRKFVETPLHDQKVTVWCGFTANFIIGPYFFHELDDNNVLQTVTVNGLRYCQMLENFVLPALRERGVLATATFMQDGAAPHIARIVKDVLDREFGQRIISRDYPHAWPARSPDLTPLDFWLWGYLKSTVYQRRRHANLAELRQSIQESIAAISPDQLQKAVYHTVHRMQAVVDNTGHHIEHLLN